MMHAAKALILAGAAISTQVSLVQGYAVPSGRATSTAPATASARALRGVGEQAWSAAELAGGASSAAAAGTEEGLLPKWGRVLLAGAAAVAVSVSGAGRATAENVIPMYFGQGCFWHVQHEMVKKEVSELGRTPQTITSLVGYAGGTQVGGKGRVCYHNLMFAPDYSSMGHTEVVGTALPESKVQEFAKSYFDSGSKYSGGRHDPQDRGGEYRSAIGLPGGMDSPVFKEIQAANAGRMELVRGMGDEPDTINTKKVFIYDSDKFPFYQGEVYHQFHDDMSERYSAAYHNFKQTLIDRKAITQGGCPELAITG